MTSNHHIILIRERVSPQCLWGQGQDNRKEKRNKNIKTKGTPRQANQNCHYLSLVQCVSVVLTIATEVHATDRSYQLLKSIAEIGPI